MATREPVDPELFGAAVYSNSFRTLEPAIGSTGLRTYPFRYDALRDTSDVRSAEEFLIASRLRRRDVDLEMSIGSYHGDTAVAMLSMLGRDGKRGSRAIKLPEPAALRMSLREAIGRRRSIRSYTGDSISLSYLSAIAKAANGITGQMQETHGIPGLVLRSVPSGGGLYPVELFFVTLRVDGLARGVYVYSPREDLVWQTGDEGRVDAVMASLANPDEIIAANQASAVCFLVARPWRSMRKYGPRGMRNVFLEAGAMAEHINLAAAALGLGSVDCGSFYDDEANEALQLDGLYEAIVHAIFLGVPG